MIKKAKKGALYKINQNRPCMAALYEGDIVKAKLIRDGGMTVGVQLLNDKVMWVVGINHLDEAILNKGGK